MFLEKRIFIIKNVFNLGREKYESVIEELKAFKRKHGECYEYHKISLYLYMQKKQYEKAYCNFFWLVNHNKFNKKQCDYGIDVFIIYPINEDKDYALGNKRIKELIEIKTLPKECVKTLEEWKSYLEKKGAGELIDYETFYERVKKNLCTDFECLCGIYSFIFLPISRNNEIDIIYERVQALLLLDNFPEKYKEKLHNTNRHFKKIGYSISNGNNEDL